METAFDLFSKLQYAIALFAVMWLIVLWLRPKVIALRDNVKAKAIAAQQRVADLASSNEPSVSPIVPATREM
jgi:hypothetical protein